MIALTARLNERDDQINVLQVHLGGGGAKGEGSKREELGGGWGVHREQGESGRSVGGRGQGRGAGFV